MNKLFIIGNGFDLAHGYATKYDDFLKWIWNNIKADKTNPKFSQLIEFYGVDNSVMESDRQINCYRDFENLIRDYKRFGESIRILNNGLSGYLSNQIYYEFKNKFFFKLCKTYPTAQWSDIESLFYKILIEVLEGNVLNGIDIDSLNSDMEVIKTLFTVYLKENIHYSDFNSNMSFPNMLKYRSMKLNNINLSQEGIDYLNEFPSKIHDRIIRRDRVIENAEKLEKWSSNNKSQTFILDFNYTETINKYLNTIDKDRFVYGEIQHIKIHGDLNDDKNPINLGFGDEMDDHYKILEKKNDNRYLKYIKSFMYSNNSNYRKLLNWIDIYQFQVIILGHSCGLSDRIMLNTIFEHENCVSIKTYFYKDKYGNDDFTDKVQNISRHFNKKKQMRDKIVDKSLSEPLLV